MGRHFSLWNRCSITPILQLTISVQVFSYNYNCNSQQYHPYQHIINSTSGEEKKVHFHKCWTEECVCHESWSQRNEKTATVIRDRELEWRGEKCMWSAYNRLERGHHHCRDVDEWTSCDRGMLVCQFWWWSWTILDLRLVLQCRNLTDKWKGLITIVVIPRPQCCKKNRKCDVSPISNDFS